MEQQKYIIRCSGEGAETTFVEHAYRSGSTIAVGYTGNAAAAMQFDTEGSALAAAREILSLEYMGKEYTVCRAALVMPAFTVSEGFRK